MQDLRSVKSQASFVLQLGYCKAKALFFTFDLQEVQEDLHYIMTHYFPQQILTAVSPIDKGTRLKQQHMILALCQYQTCDHEQRHHLEAKAQQAVTVQVVTTGITPQLAPSERLREAETEPCHHGGPRHTLR
jgi:hypothetical protein